MQHSEHSVAGRLNISSGEVQTQACYMTNLHFQKARERVCVWGGGGGGGVIALSRRSLVGSIFFKFAVKCEAYWDIITLFVLDEDDFFSKMAPHAILMAKRKIY
jgi:hypothetical protein